MNDLVFLSNDLPVTSSLVIASETGNEHKNVLALIRAYLSDLEEFGGVAFQTQPFETAGGTQQREVALLNEQQATLLITYMRNSDVVRAFKIRLVKAFYELAARLRERPMTTGEALIQMATAYYQHEQRIAAIEADQAETKQAIAELVGGDDYATAKGFARFNGYPADLRSLSQLGKTASAMCRQRGIRIGRVNDENWGEVNSYPRDLLKEAADMLLGAK